MQKTINNKAWLLVIPVFICVAFSALIPLMTVVNYSVQDILGPDQRVFVGTEWFLQVLQDDDLHAALIRQMEFSAIVLLIEIPLGIALALTLPISGWRASLCLVLLALPLLIPWNVVGTIWQIFGRGDIGLAGYLAWLYLQIDGWWIPYVGGYSPGGRAFYAKYFAETWKPLPSWGDHLAPDAMHVVLQSLIVAAIATALLAIYGRTKMSLGSTSPTPTPNSGTKSVPRVARPW